MDDHRPGRCGGAVMPTFEATRAEYERMWDSVVVTPSRSAIVDSVARKAIANKLRYQQIEAATGVPWFVVAILHNRESGLNFSRHLHNGDPLTARTRQVPAGRPKGGKPPFSFEESAIDALMMPPHLLHKVTDWNIARICYESEKYNGWGYRKFKINSPYLWSFTNHYKQGKYVADGKWSATAVDRQIGCMAHLKAMMKLDPSIGRAIFGGPVVAPPPPDVEPPPDKPEAVPFWKRWWKWLTGTGALGTVGVGGFTLNTETAIAIGGLLSLLAVLFLGWVYLVPPRGRIRKW